MSDRHDRRSPIEHRERETAKQQYRTTEQRIADLIEEAARAKHHAGQPNAPGGTEYFRTIADICREDLAPLLQRHLGQSPLARSELDASPRYHHGELETFVHHGPGDASRTEWRRTILRAFESLVRVAETDEVVTDEYRSRAHALGLSCKIGEHLQKWEMDLGEAVDATSLQAGTVKTLLCGGTGFGKSAGGETEAEDYYQHTFRDGRDYKLIDPVDLGSGESWFYDIPQMQAALRRIRAEMGLPKDFTETPEMVLAREYGHFPELGEHDMPDDHTVADRGLGAVPDRHQYDCPQCNETHHDLDDLVEHMDAEHSYERPQLQIRVPLTPGLSTQPLPFDTDAEEFVVKPFVIPATDLRKSVLIPCILSRVSDQQENTIRQAYDDVNRAHDDWSLKDLADEIRSRDELSGKHKADAVGVLRSLQDEGFIRTRDHEFALDWRDIFHETETITLFSQALIPDSDIGQMICVAYLVDKILQLRRRMHDVPEAVQFMREFWQVAPHKERQSSDARAAAIQEAIGDRMTRAFRQNRHYGLHLICDTQEPGDLLKSVREVFNRYVVYSANKDTIKDIFDWTQNDKWRGFWTTMSVEKGQAGVVGQVGAAMKSHRTEYLSPLEYAPPSHHHFDQDRDSTGWHTRAKHFTPDEACPECDSAALDRDATRMTCEDCGHQWLDASLGHEEVLREPMDVEGVEWDDQLPDELKIAAETSDGPSVQERPVAAFADECLQPADADEWVELQAVRSAFNEFLTQHDREPWNFHEESRKITFGKRLKACRDDHDKRRRQGEHSLVKTRLTASGEQYLSSAGGEVDELTSAAEPIRSDD